MRFFRRQSNSQWLRTILVLALSLGLVQPSGGQQIGFDICTCSPSKYEFKFDFSLYCPPINITQGDAVVDTTCSVGPFQDQSVGNLVPISVQEILVLELDQNFDTMLSTPIPGDFKDGDTFTYTSYSATPGETDPTKLVRGIQFTIVGINILEQPIINNVLITFSNSCQAYPVLIPGQYAGWVRFLNLEEPLPEYCPTETDPPTPTPTAQTAPPFTPPTPPPSQMSMSMDLGMLDLLEDEFGLSKSECTESSSTKYTKKSRAGKSGKGGSSPKGSKKMGKGGAGKGGSSGDSSSMMTDPSLKSDSSSKGKGGKGGKGSGSGSGSGRLLRSKGSNRVVGDCEGKGKGKGNKKAAKSGKKDGSSSKKSSKSGKAGKGSKKSGKGGKGSGSGSGSSKGQYKISKKESSESRRFIL